MAYNKGYICGGSSNKKWKGLRKSFKERKNFISSQFHWEYPLDPNPQIGKTPQGGKDICKDRTDP
jgi:hypothetical protein